MNNKLQWVILLAVFMVCGTAVFIYESAKADQVRREHEAQVAKEKEEQEEKAEEAARADIAYRKQVAAQNAATLDKAFEQMNQTRRDQAQSDLAEEILAEMKKANGLAQSRLAFERLNSLTHDSSLSDQNWLLKQQTDDLNRIRQIYELNH